MKKLSTILISMFLVLSMTLAIVKATAPTVVNGHVYAADGITPLPGVEVTVECDEEVEVDTTNAEGFYVVEFFEGCDLGDIVTVSAGGVSEEDTVADFIVEKNLVYVNLTVPEFGILGALAALAGSAVLFTVIRKKNGRK